MHRAHADITADDAAQTIGRAQLQCAIGQHACGQPAAAIAQMHLLTMQHVTRGKALLKRRKALLGKQLGRGCHHFRFTFFRFLDNSHRVFLLAPCSAECAGCGFF